MQKWLRGPNKGRPSRSSQTISLPIAYEYEIRCARGVFQSGNYYSAVAEI